MWDKDSQRNKPLGFNKMLTVSKLSNEHKPLFLVQEISGPIVPLSHEFSRLLTCFQGLINIFNDVINIFDAD